MTIRRILCPIDFSENSMHAMERAVGLARASGGRLTVLHVYPPVLPRTGVPAVDTDLARIIAPADLQALRDRVAEACRPARDAGIGVDEVVVGGQPMRAILDHAASTSADLIVMGTHGASGFQHLLLGSVTEKVLRKAACPVLTVPPRADPAGAGVFTRVLCAVDFSDCSLKAAAAAAVAMDAGAALTLLHVVEWPWHEPPVPGMPDVPPDQARAMLEYRQYLEAGAAARLASIASTITSGRPAAVQVRFGTPYIELLDAARELGADLIVLGVRGRRAVDLALFGSTTNHVVRTATCPVLTVVA